jgi:alkaline phosphatase
MQSAPHFKLGLITDIHYDGSAEDMNRLYEAVVTLNNGEADALVVMGDLIDGENEFHAKRLLREVTALCDAFNGQIYFMHGNHDLDYLSKEQFYNAIGRVGDPSRFTFELSGINFICIDGNFTPDGAAYNCGNFNWRESYVPPAELDWLRRELELVKGSAVVISHQRTDKESVYAVRNHEAVREVIRESGKVAVVLHGHQHADDLQRIENSVYYTLGAHKDGAGPAVLALEDKKLKLIRDMKALEAANG